MEGSLRGRDESMSAIANEFRVLVVEDDPRSREFYETALRQEGYAAVGVRSGREALDTLKSQSVHFVLLDILMEEMDGIETVRRIREDLQRKELPVCMITASMDMEKVVHSFECGANGYIVKPFDLDELVRKIEELRAKAI